MKPAPSAQHSPPALAGAVRPECPEIEAALRSALAPTEIFVRDDSHQHAGHAGAREGGHYFVRIRSERFRQLGRVARHRLIYDALKAWMPRGIHALAMDARTPDEA